VWNLNGSITAYTYQPAHDGTYLRTIIIYIISVLYWVPAAAAHQYVVRFDAGLVTLRVSARFASPVDSVRARDRSAGRFLLEAADCDTGLPLERRGRTLASTQGPIGCIDYVVDLRNAAATERRNEGLAPDNVVVSPAVWLWQPKTDTKPRITVRFLPGDGADVSVPWKAVEDAEHTYEIPPSPRSARAPVAFGRFIHIREEPSAGMPRIALLRSRGDVDDDAIIGWVRDTAGYVSLAYGRFPNPGAHVVVMPVGRNGWQSDSPVPFGRVVRDGGESIELFIDERRPIEDFYGDWTATHEFSHLMLPFLQSSHRWISEGFAQYYQNVLLARAGRYDAQRAWQKLYEGFERGRKSRPELSPNEASRRGVGAATMKIYWSGAILALMADVELRQRSAGRESLDDVLDQLQRCCLPAAKRWTGPQLFGKLDSFLEEPVFMPLYRQYADREGFPDIAPLFKRLGIDIGDDRVALHGDAELAEIRKAITRSPTGAGARAFIDRSKAQQAKRSEP
jgi:hypothetical protein